MTCCAKCNGPAQVEARPKSVSERPPAAQPLPPQEPEPVIDARMIVFERLPLSDTCWSLSTGPDDRIYAAACTEHIGGVAAYLMRYTPAAELGKGRLEYLFDVGDAVGEPANNGRATQCKIHYCLLPDPSTGILYGACLLYTSPSPRDS